MLRACALGFAWGDVPAWNIAYTYEAVGTHTQTRGVPPPARITRAPATCVSTVFLSQVLHLQVLQLPSPCAEVSLAFAGVLQAYGVGNERRAGSMLLQGGCTWGVGDRSCTVFVPDSTLVNRCGYFVDQRPASSMDPYMALMFLICTTLQMPVRTLRCVAHGVQLCAL